MTIEELKVLRESEDHVEFKAAQHSYPFNGGSHKEQSERRRCFLGYVVALSNELGGDLVLGMADKHPHDVVGTDFALGQVGELEDAVYGQLQIRVHCEELYDELGKRVLVTHIPSRPIGRRMKFEGVALMRTGDSLRNMSDEEEFAILSESEPDFSANICNGLSLSDLDENAIDELKDAYSNKQENSGLVHLPLDRILSDLKLLNSNGQLTNAALILLAKAAVLEKYLPQAKIIWEYRSTDSQIHYDNRKVVSEPLFLAIKTIWNLINQPALNKKHPFLRTGGYIFDVYDFNEGVVREAILNAIAHRDYKIASEIVIKQYPHRVIIANPGGFPKGVTIDNLIIVNSTPRSRLMTEILEKTGLVERSGQGIDKIYAYTLAEGKGMPDYTRSDYFQVMLSLSAKIEDPAFHSMIRPFYKNGELTLGVDDVLTLYHIKTNSKIHFNRDVVDGLKKRGLIRIDNKGGYLLPESYYAYKRSTKRKVGLYYEEDVRDLLKALGSEGNKSIGEIEKQYAEKPNRNQLKYLVSKLCGDEIIYSNGRGKGTRYFINNKFNAIDDVEAMVRIVIKYIEDLYL